MFDRFYEFEKVCRTQALHKLYLKETVKYKFTTGKTRYIVEVERYDEEIYVIKFYRNQDKKNKNKYNILTGEGICTSIVSTCIRILLSILKESPTASFGFIGANTIDKQNGIIEPKHSTKRFKVYKKTMENLIGDEYFYHAIDSLNSTYLMVNNKVNSVVSFVDKAKLMFEKIYPELESN